MYFLLWMWWNCSCCELAVGGCDLAVVAITLLVVMAGVFTMHVVGLFVLGISVGCCDLDLWCCTFVCGYDWYFLRACGGGVLL